jgi:hypothetical protein
MQLSRKRDNMLEGIWEYDFVSVHGLDASRAGGAVLHCHGKPHPPGFTHTLSVVLINMAIPCG